MKTSEYIKKYNLKEKFIKSKSDDFLEDFYFDFLSNVEITKERVSEFTEDKFQKIVENFREKFESIFNKCPMAYPEYLWGDFERKYVPMILFEIFPHLKEDMERVDKMDYVTLYKYIFDTLDMGSICGDKYVSRPYEDDYYNGIFSTVGGKLTNSPRSHFLESIIRTCGQIFQYKLYYIEYYSLERFLKWSENKLKVVNKNEREKYKRQQENPFFEFDPFSFFNFFRDRMKQRMVNTLEVIDNFNVLGIEVTKNEDEIKKAYKLLAVKFHPDKIGNSTENHEKMVSINIAKTKCLMYANLKNYE